MLYNKAIGATASAQKIYIEDAFSAYLYTGNGSTQTITNGIDLSGKGGLVWIKSRSVSQDHALYDTARGPSNRLYSNSTIQQITDSGVDQFSSNGFSIGSSSSANANADNYTSWTFRKTAKFFDVVTYTGTGANRTISHNLGSVPGCIIVKRTDTAAGWQVYHRSLANTEYLVLNSTAAKATGATRWNSTTPTSTEFSLGTDTTVNANGGTYVAYLFAHDAGGFGDSGNDNVISCGSYTGNGSINTVSLGWEPQWLLIKRSDSTGDWNLIDNQRGFPVGSDGAELNPNLADAEGVGTIASPLATGFELNSTDTGYNQSGGTYIYIAIRRGPMKTPTDATNVFQAKVYTGTNVDNRLVTTDILTDMVWARQRNDSVLAGMVVGDRLRGQPYLLTGGTAAEVNDADSFDKQLVSAVEYGTAFSSMTGFWVGNDATSKLNANTTSNNHVAYAFRRAPGFFDVVAYTGTGSARTVSHNLGVATEFYIVKSRSNTSTAWLCGGSVIGSTTADYLQLQNNGAKATYSSLWQAPTSTTIGFGANGASDPSLNASSYTYIAYLFASCPGVSKVGSYTGTGTTKQIDCGFTNGARFVLIKRTDSTGDWYVWDTARGIVSANDPYLLLNSIAAEVTNTDYIDPLSSGFEISSTAPAAINANGGSYIYLSVA